jgi:GTP cyclohydrolase I
MDKRKIESAIRSILEAIGEDLNRDGLKETPRRVADLYEDLFSGVGRDVAREIRQYAVENYDGMILAHDLPLLSVCEHHLLPFVGKVHVVYIPRDDLIVGFSSLIQIVETLAKRPQLQERLTGQIADAMMEVLKPAGVLVLIEAEHLCITMRGAQKPGTVTVTVATRGEMDSCSKRDEALALIKGI